MHLFGVAFVVSGILFAIFQKQTLILYFLFTIAVYMAISTVLPGGKKISNRKKIMVSTWTDPSEGVIQVKVPCRTEKVQEVIKNATGDEKLTMTHFVIKAAGNLLGHSSDLNGKLSFGKFVPADSADVSCLVDIEGGKDLAMILVESADKKSVKDIAKFLREKGSKIKTNKGDADHKQRTKAADYFPAFLVSVMIKLASFLTNKIGISVPALALKKHQFGAACVTSLGMLGFEDATAPFSGFMGCVLFISANAIHEQPVVNNGKVEVGRVINCNFVVDHRYIDGGKAKRFIKIFKEVFENPQAYVDQAGPAPEIKEAKKQA